MAAALKALEMISVGAAAKASFEEMILSGRVTCHFRLHPMRPQAAIRRRHLVVWASPLKVPEPQWEIRVSFLVFAQYRGRRVVR